MSILFDGFSIGSMDLRNRFVRSATFESAADEHGLVTDYFVRLFADLAGGGVGLIISGLAFVHPSGQLSPVQTSVADDRVIPGLARLTETVHSLGGKTAIQLSHAGRESVRYFKFLADRVALGPSYVEDDPYRPGEYREMTETDIQTAIAAFGQAARRAKEAGFDAVQVHGAHAYLFSQFLSPHSNRREDSWGGTLNNRLRIHREVYRAIRAEVGDEYPIVIKLGVQDGFPGGLEFAEGLQAAKSLAEIGFNAIEVSQGLRGASYTECEFRTKVLREADEAYFREWTRKVKEVVSVPVIMIGGLRTPRLMEDALTRGDADLVALCRPLISEPDLISRWEEGDLSRPRCVSCNKCLEAVKARQPLGCVYHRKD